jgi:hypothetical protein
VEDREGGEPGGRDEQPGPVQPDRHPVERVELLDVVRIRHRDLLRSPYPGD